MVICFMLQYTAPWLALLEGEGARLLGEHGKRAQENVRGNWARSQQGPTPTTIPCRGDFGSRSLFKNQGETIWLFAVKEDSWKSISNQTNTFTKQNKQKQLQHSSVIFISCEPQNGAATCRWQSGWRFDTSFTLRALFFSWKQTDFCFK